MTHTISMRAASVATSAALLGIVMIGAFSVTITLGPTMEETPISFPWVEPLEPEPPPTTPRQTEPPPPRPQPDETTTLVADPPPIFTDPNSIGTFTDLLPPTGPAEITNPRWLRVPRELARYYPSRALAREIRGQVVLDCLVDVYGSLNCSVLSETPANWGFGEAALRISRDYRMAPAMRDGLAVEGRYRMRVPFEVQ